ncbi:hypothetical protein BDZ89DRAFT_188436 [Hymenopellis radicata]|nr:hypothetical protein BDZ89DRAFT_188436 [Hymenopellis radicata]
MEHTMEYARGQHKLLFSTLVKLQVIPDPKECTSDPFSGFEDAGETIQLEPKLLLDETDGRYFGKEYPLERNSNATLTVGDTLRINVLSYSRKSFFYVAHLRVSPRTLRTTTRKRYCALLYVLFCGDIGDTTFDPTNEFLIQKILEDNPTPSGVHTRLYPSNQYLWVDAAVLLTYGHHIFVEGVSPPRDNIGEVQYLATHLWLYPKAHGDWRLQNDNYGVEAQFCPLKRRDGSRNFPFRLEGFHDRDDVTPSPLLIEETWEQIAKLYDFTQVGRERALFRSEAREYVQCVERRVMHILT